MLSLALHIFAFSAIYLIDIFDNKYYSKNIEKVEIGRFSGYYHIYFSYMASFIWKDYVNFYLCLLYFSSDILFLKYFNKLSTFTFYHHTICILNFLLHFLDFSKSHIEMYNLISYMEYSTIILSLYNKNIISKDIFNAFFPIIFITSRFGLFNYVILSKNYNNLLLYFMLILLNIMNIGIALKMNLFRKALISLTKIHYIIPA